MEDRKQILATLEIRETEKIGNSPKNCRYYRNTILEPSLANNVKAGPWLVGVQLNP